MGRRQVNIRSVTQPILSFVVLVLIALHSSYMPADCARADDGDLDPRFGEGGKVTTRFYPYSDNYAQAIAIQADGKVIVAGHIVKDRVNEDELLLGFGLARYNNDGSLDATFGGDGKVFTSDKVGFRDATALAIQPDGKIVAAGSGLIRAGLSSVKSFAVARYESDGGLDSTFGNGGRVLTDVDGGNFDDVTAVGVAIQRDGRIVVAGE